MNATELGRLSAPSGTLFFGNSASGVLTVSAPLTFAKSIALTANVMNIGALVTTTAGDITVAPSASRNITLGTDDVVGTSLGFTTTEIDRFKPAGGAGVLRIGDFTNTNAISVTAAIAPANTTILSLRNGSGTVTQTTGSTITDSNFACRFGERNHAQRSQ